MTPLHWIHLPKTRSSTNNLAKLSERWSVNVFKRIHQRDQRPPNCSSTRSLRYLTLVQLWALIISWRIASYWQGKAKDRKFLQQSLVTSAPNIDARISQRNRSAGVSSGGKKSGGAGASGRLHRNDAGDWVWSSDDDDEDTTNTSTSSREEDSSSIVTNWAMLDDKCRKERKTIIV